MKKITSLLLFAFVATFGYSQCTVSIAGNATLCLGKSTTLTASFTPASSSVGYSWNTGSSASSIIVSPSASTTYTVIATDLVNSCADTLAFTVLVSVCPTNSACGNKDFENGDFTNWIAASGSIATMANATWTGGINFQGNDVPIVSTAQHTILTVNKLDSLAWDPITNLPDVFMTTLAPNGGNFSVRLGNANPGCGAEALRIQFSPTASDSVFTFQFAAVHQNANHATPEEPGFRVHVYDINGTLIPWLSDTVWAPDPKYPFIPVSASAPDPTILYKRWSSVSLGMSAFIGQTMTVEFTNFDCAFCGHYGYTYLDLSCYGQTIANVWPGDCDYDLNANVADVLFLGMAYGSTGTTRVGASNSWTAQPSTDWAQGFPLGANYKHSDCNGDGIVNLDDTLAIALNYNSVHPFKIQTPPAYNNALPDLSIVIAPDSVGVNTLVNADIMLGSGSIPVDSIYGLCFTINYDPNYLNGLKLGASFGTSWMGTIGTDLMSVQKSMHANGKMDIALTRINHSNKLGGNGKIGTFSFRSTPITSVGAGNIPFTISDVKAITVTGRVVSLNTKGDNLFFDPTLLGVSEYLNPNSVSVFPMPAKDAITIALPFDEENIRVTIYNPIGQEVLSAINSGETFKQDISSLPAGSYQLRITTSQGMIVKKLQVVK